MDLYASSSIATFRIVMYVFGYGAALLACLTCWPQVIKTMRTLNTINISLKTFIIYNTANVVWLLFGILTLTLPGLKSNNVMWALTLIIPYSVTIVAVSIVMGFKIYHIKKYHESSASVSSDSLKISKS